MSTRVFAFLLLAAAFATALAQLTAQGRQRDRIPPGLLARAARGERLPVIIELRSQPDDTPDMPRAQAAARGIARAQERFLVRTPGFGHIKRLTSLPIIAIEVDQRILSDLAADPEVISISLDEPRRPSLTTSVPLVGAPTAWGLGASGLGWSIAVLDTGVDKAHPFLAGKVVSEACYGTNLAGVTSTCPGSVDTTAVGSGVPCPAGVHGCEHGTHLAGIAAGHRGSLSGVARDASIIAIKVFSRIIDPNFCYPEGSPCVGAFDSDILAGLDRVYALRTQFDIAAANLSLGGGAYTGSCDAALPAYKSAIDLLRSAGIATVVASGNNGSKSWMSAPACISSAVSVGSSTKADQLASYTNRSPLLKLLAPGSLIYSSVPGGGYATFSGTSMAAPHVAGAWAVLKSRQPAASVTDVLTALTSTGAAIADAANGRTWPRIRVDGAIQKLPLGPPVVTSLTASPTLPQPANVPITWTARAVGGAAALQFKFWVYNAQTATWTLLQDYSAAKSVVWTPSFPGTYAVRVWVRAIGSNADFQASLASGNFSIVSQPPTLLSVTSDHVSPLYANVPVTWTAHVRGGTGPLEYRFWRLNLTTSNWTMVQEYSPANTFTWTPTPTDSGSFLLQVWVRAIGSAASYEAWLNSGTFSLLGTTNFVVNSQPGDWVGAGQHFVRSGAGATMMLHTTSQAADIGYFRLEPFSNWGFEFAAPHGQVLTPGVYENATRWPFQLSTEPGLNIDGDSRGCNTLTGRFVVLDVAQVNNEYTRFAADFEQHCEGFPPALFGSVRFNSAVPPSERPVAIQSLTTSTTFPAKAGVPMTWTATAIGGGAPLQYKFWLHSSATGAWSIVQDGPSNTLVMTPPLAATYALQVWVRSTGSQAPYEAWKGSGEFSAIATPVQMTAFNANTTFPVTVNTPIAWTATATGGSGSLEYQYWRYRAATGSWTIVQPYSPVNTFTWQPSAGEAGTYALQVWVRSVGSAASWEAWSGTGYFLVTDGGAP